MSRRRRVIHKVEKIDSRYGSPLVARLIGTIMLSGQRSLAERVVYAAIEESRQNSEAIDPLETLNKAVENVRPRLETKSRRVGGATYQVPMEVAPARGLRRVTLCRELTKQFEAVATMPAAELPGWIGVDPNRSRGEFVLVLHAVADLAAADETAAASLSTLRTLLAALPLKQAVALAAELTGAPRNALYAQALALKNAPVPDASAGD